MPPPNAPADPPPAGAVASTPTLGAGRPAVASLYVLAFCSGAAALIYEVVWAKMLALTFGSTTLATAAVVAGFMGGMGLGAWLYHLVSARVARPLLLYALLEMGIAASAVLLTAVISSLPSLFAAASETVPPGLLYEGLRFLGVFVLLLVPSVLMGATFPAFCAVVIRTADGVDRHLGVIYGVNTIGAAAGVLVGGLVLIERVGLTSSVHAANLINLAVALAALALLRSALGRGGARSGGQGPTAIPTALPRAVTGAVLLGSGFCTLSYEILWFRAMRYLTGTSTYAFTIVLFTFLVGLGLGSLLLRRVARRASPEADLAVCQCAIAVLALLAMAGQLLLAEVPALRDQISIFSGVVRYRPWAWRLLVDAGVAFATMLPATVVMGLSFPLAARLFLGDVRKLDTRVGAAYLLANVGSVVGAIGGAALLLPLFGTLGGTKVGAAVNVVLAILILLAVRPRPRGHRLVVQLSAALVVVLVTVLPGAVRFRGENLDENEPGIVVFTEEGDLATVQVLLDPGDSSRRAMTIDGYKIGWSEGFHGSLYYRKQVLLAHLPMTLDRRIRRTLSIGLGSAATLKAISSHPQVATLDCVEINGAVARASRLFPESDVLDDPRVDLVVDDAVHYLLRSGQGYDLIVSDGKQDPLYSGNAVLLCREFYEYARDRLTDGGLFAQWIPLGTLHEDFRVTLRTFCAVFPHADVFFFPPDSVLMVGGGQPLAGRPGLSPREYAASPAGAALAEYFLPSRAALLSHWVAGRGSLQHAVDDGPLSTWDHLRLDYTPFKASLEAWAESGPRNLELLIRAEQHADASAGPDLGRGEQAFRQSTRLLRHALLASHRGDAAEARRLAGRALELNPEDGSARFFLTRGAGRERPGPGQ